MPFSDCYDSKRATQSVFPQHLGTHEWIPVEVGHQDIVSNVTKAQIPERAGGFEVHNVRCQGCQMNPVIGYRFTCLECNNMDFCSDFAGLNFFFDSVIGQKCFFLKKEPHNHSSNHYMELILEADKVSPTVKWFVNSIVSQVLNSGSVICGVKPIVGMWYKCNSCFKYTLCENCHAANAPPPLFIISHKSFHTFTKMSGEQTVSLKHRNRS